MRSISKNCVTSFDSYFENAPRASILYLNKLDKKLKEKISFSGSLSILLSKCPELKKYIYHELPGI